ncbi:MAG: glycosyltransferase [Clostridia bacterium]|nr:glycosyltransferase [Clostridia bacterium]
MKIRVLHCISDSNIGGAGRLLLHLLRHFDKDVFDVTAVVPKGSALVPRIEECGIPVIETEHGRDASHDRGGITELCGIMRRVKPHIVHTHSSLDAKIAAWLCGVKCRIYTRHSVFDPPRRLTTFPGKQIAGAVNNTLATRIIAVAQAAADILTATGVREDKITVILNGVEPLTPSTAEECVALRRELGFADTDFVCGISARMEPYKGHSYLVETARAVCAVRPDAKFLVMGTGTTYEETVRLAREAGLDGKMVFTGFVTDVVPYYSIMNLSLNCSWGTEATSLALIEAMSLGLPAVVTSFGGNPGVIEDGVNGFLVPEKDSDAMAAAILRIMEDPALYDTLSAGAKTRFGERFTARAMTEQLETVYKEEARRGGFLH